MTRREDRLFRRFQARRESRDLARVFDLTAKELLAVALHLTRDPHRAEDLVQATFLTAIEDASRWDPARPVRPWLLGILANRVREERRRARREEPSGFVAAGAEDRDDPLARAGDRELADRAGHALRDLRDPYRQVLLLYLVHGLSGREIAEVVGRPAGTVRTQITRGLELLRGALPPSLIAGLALTATTGRGLAAVRQVVLERAGTSAGVTAAAGAAAPALIGGLLLMKNPWVPLVTAALLGWLALDLLAGSDAPAPAGDPPIVDSRARTDPVRDPAAAAERVALPGPRPAEAGTTPPADQARTGALRVRVLYPDGGPAVGILLRPPRGADAHTGAAGEALFGALPADEDVRVHLPQCSKIAWARIQAGGEVVETVRIARGIDLEGTVVDHEGRAVAGAAVQTLGNFEYHQTIARTDARGAFAVRSFHPGQGLLARAGGHRVGREVHPDGKDGTRVRVELRLGGRGTRLAGVVRTAAGTPLGGAELAILELGPFHTPPPLFVTAGSDGRFATDEAGAGRVVISAQGRQGETLHRALRELELSASGTTEVDVTAASGGAVFGRVADDAGQARANLQVVARFRHPHLHDLPFGRVATYSDRDGAYRLAGLLPGAYEVETGDRGNRAREEINVGAAAETRWDPVLATAADLAIRLIDERDRPLVDWRVEMLSAEGFPRGGRITDAEGLCRFERLGRTALRFAVHAPVGDDPVDGFKDYAGIANLWTGPLLPRDEPHTVRVPAASISSVRITGRLVDARGAPLAGGVRIYKEGDNTMHVAFAVGADGQFATVPLAAHTYQIECSAEGHPTRVLGPQAATAGQDLALGDVRMPDAARLRVTVEGVGAQAARVAVHRGAGLRTLRRQRDGSFGSGILSPGRWTVQVSGPGIAPRLQDVELAAGTNAVTCTVAAAPTLDVALLLREDRPDAAHWASTAKVFDDAGALVLVERCDVRLADPTSHRVDMAFGLAPGSYRIEVLGWEGSRGSVHVTVGADGAAAVQVRLRR